MGNSCEIVVGFYFRRRVFLPGSDEAVFRLILGKRDHRVPLGSLWQSRYGARGSGMS